MELGSNEGRVLTQKPLVTLHTPVGSGLFYITQQEGRFYPCPVTTQPVKNCHNSANEKLPQPKLSFASNETS